MTEGDIHTSENNWRALAIDLIKQVRAKPVPIDPGQRLSHLCLLRCAHLLEQMLAASDSGVEELALLALRPIIETAGYACYYHLKPEEYERAFVSSDRTMEKLAELVHNSFTPTGSEGAEVVNWDQAWEAAIKEGVDLTIGELRFWYRASSDVAMHGGLAAIDRYVTAEGQAVAHPPLPVDEADILCEMAGVFILHAALLSGYPAPHIHPEVR